MNEAKDFSSTVVVDRSGMNSLPKAVKDGFASIKSNTIPQVVIADATGNKVYGAYSYESMRTRNFRSLWKDAVKTMKEEGKEIKREAEAAAKEAAFKTWTSTSGSKIEARIFSINGEQVTLITREGKAFKLNKSQLDAASQAQLLEES